MRMKHFVLLSTILTTVISFGCASIVSKSSWPVSITSSPTEAAVAIKDKIGREIFKGSTPTIITLPSSSGYFSGASYTVMFEKDGYEQLTMSLEKELNGWYIGNILFGGLIGLLIVDPATGAMWKLPEGLHGTLAQKKTSIILDGRELSVVLLEDVPDELRKVMLRIN